MHTHTHTHTLSVLPCLKAFAVTAPLWNHYFLFWSCTCLSSLWYSYLRKEPFLVPRSPQPLVSCPLSAVHTNMPGTFLHHSILHNWTVTSGKLICMTVPPRLSPLGQEVCLIGSGTPRLQSVGSQRVRHDLVTEHTRTYLWSRTMVSSILLFLPAGSPKPPAQQELHVLQVWAERSLPGGAKGFPDMKLVWPNIGRASGGRPQGVQRWVSMLPQMTDPRPKGQGAEASSLPLSFQESFWKGTPGCDAATCQLIQWTDKGITWQAALAILVPWFIVTYYMCSLFSSSSM